MNPSDSERDRWASPDPETVALGVHRIPLPLPMDGLRAVNVYAIEDADGLVLIDGGWALDVSRDALERSLAVVGYELRDIRRILVTHMHRDHYTQAVAIRRAVGAEVAIGVGERASIDALIARTDGLFSSQPARLRRLGALELAGQVEASPVDASATLSFYEPPDVWLEPGRVELSSGSLDAIETPGHTRGHLVFHSVESGLLYSGDHLLPHITPSIGFEPDRPQFPLRDYLDSLERMLTLPDARLLPAHGPAGGSSHARALELIAHHEERLGEASAALRAGAGLTLDVARILRWTRRGRAFDDLHLFDRMLAVLETAAHLDVLVLRGDAVRDERGDVVTYEAVTG